MTPSRTAAQDHAGFSIACALGGSLAFSVNDIAVKSFASSLPLHEVVLFRALVALAFTLAVFAPGMAVRDVLRTRRPGAHLFRGICVVVSNMTYFAALASLPLAETSAIFFIAPLLITALSAVLLRERVGALRWAALCAGLTGVLLIVKPGTTAFQWAMVLPAFSALAYAGMHTMTRRMGLSEPAATMAVYNQITFIVVCAGMGLAVGRGELAGSGHPALEFIFRAWVVPGPRDLLLFLVAGMCSATGGYLVSQAYRSSAAGLVAPFEYVALVLAAFWGWAIWGELPGLSSGLGILLILASGVFVAWRASRHRAVTSP
jgi:drug/metabolite transporter (DMT)-like permease